MAKPKVSNIPPEVSSPPLGETVPASPPAVISFDTTSTGSAGGNGHAENGHNGNGHNGNGHETVTHECDTEARCRSCDEVLPWPLYQIRNIDGDLIPDAAKTVAELIAVVTDAPDPETNDSANEERNENA